MNKVSILGVGFDPVDLNGALNRVKELIQKDETSLVATPNPEILVNASNIPALKVALNSAGLVIADGIGVIYGAKMLKKPLKTRVTGVDLMTAVLSHLSTCGGKYFLFGSKPGVAEEARRNIDQRFDGIVCVGTRDGYFKAEEEEKIIEEINLANPDVLFVGLGSPKQELWVWENREKLKSPVCLCIGGAIDVYSGNVKRAPAWISKIGFEWLYRAIKEPKRFKRLLKIPVFLVRVLKYKE